MANEVGGVVLNRECALLSKACHARIEHAQSNAAWTTSEQFYFVEMADKTVSQTISCQTDDLKNHVQTNTLKKIKELEDEVEKIQAQIRGLSNLRKAKVLMIRALKAQLVCIHSNYLYQKITCIFGAGNRNSAKPPPAAKPWKRKRNWHE